MLNSGGFDDSKPGEILHICIPYLLFARGLRRSGGKLTGNDGFYGLAKGNMGYDAETGNANGS